MAKQLKNLMFVSTLILLASFQYRPSNGCNVSEDPRAIYTYLVGNTCADRTL